MKTALDELIEWMQDEPILFETAIKKAAFLKEKEKLDLMDAYNAGKVDKAMVYEDREPFHQNCDHYYAETFFTKN
jgi:hypothetical protein